MSSSAAQPCAARAPQLCATPAAPLCAVIPNVHVVSLAHPFPCNNWLAIPCALFPQPQTRPALNSQGNADSSAAFVAELYPGSNSRA